MKILVTGSSGKVGSEVVKELHKRGAAVRALAHKEGKGTDLPEEVEVVVGDLPDPASVRNALDGVEKLYLLNAVVPDELTQGLIAYGLAKKLKTGRLPLGLRGGSLQGCPPLRLEACHRERAAGVGADDAASLADALERIVGSGVGNESGAENPNPFSYVAGWRKTSL